MSFSFLADTWQHAEPLTEKNSGTQFISLAAVNTDALQMQGIASVYPRNLAAIVAVAMQ